MAIRVGRDPMTGRSVDHAGRSALDALADAALYVIDELTPGDLLAAITPERLGERSGYAPSSVRYQLSRAAPKSKSTPTPGPPASVLPGAEPLPIVTRKRWAFDREHVLLIALRALAEHRRRATETSVNRYLAALTAAGRDGDLGPLVSAIQADLDTSTPGATDQGSALTSERVRSIAIAAADASVDVARQLRLDQQQRLAQYLPVYDLAMAMTGRVLRDGISAGDLALQVSLLLEGIAQRRRFDPSLDERRVLDAVLSIFQGLTRPVDQPGSPGPVATFVAELARGRPG